jgi:hypothetical protein
MIAPPRKSLFNSPFRIPHFQLFKLTMPCLPSGLHFAIDPSPLSQLVEGALQGAFVHELMAIKDCGDIFRHIDVLYFKQRAEDPGEYRFAAESIARPEGLEPYPSGFTLLSISGEVKKWSEADRSAFIDFLNEDRTEEFFKSLIRSVEEAQKNLLSHPGTLPGMLATWWKLGCHPLQEGGEALGE